MWEFEFHLRKTTTARRPDLILELKTDKKIRICDMACSQQNNIGAKRTENLTKYRQLALETRERRPCYEIYVVPVVVTALDGDIKALKVNLKKIFHNSKLLGGHSIITFALRGGRGVPQNANKSERGEGVFFLPSRTFAKKNFFLLTS